MKARTMVGRGEKCLLIGPGSGLRHGREKAEEKRAEAKTG